MQIYKKKKKTELNRIKAIANQTRVIKFVSLKRLTLCLILQVAQSAEAIEYTDYFSAES